MDRHRIRLAAAIIVIILTVAAGAALTLATHRHTATAERTRSETLSTGRAKEWTSTSDPDTPLESGRKQERRSDEACSRVAPLAVRTYIGDHETREQDLMDYFIEDAEGLEVPVDQLRHDDAGLIGTGYVQVAVNDDAASCMVKTASGVTWEVRYRDFDRDGYKASAIISHNEGRAYNLHPTY